MRGYSLSCPGDDEGPIMFIVAESPMDVARALNAKDIRPWKESEEAVDRANGVKKTKTDPSPASMSVVLQAPAAQVQRAEDKVWLLELSEESFRIGKGKNRGMLVRYVDARNGESVELLARKGDRITYFLKEVPFLPVNELFRTAMRAS